MGVFKLITPVGLETLPSEVEFDLNEIPENKCFALCRFVSKCLKANSQK